MALTDNLISYYKFDEASGTRVDSHGSNDLTDNNTVGSATGIINNGADFERSNGDEYLSYADSGTFNPSGSFSIALWYKLESTGSSSMLVDYGNDASTGWLLQSEATRIFARRNTSTGNKDAAYTFTQDTNWHHVALVVEQGSTLKIYHDGIERTSVACGGTGDGTTGQFKFGALLNGGSYINETDGIIDESGFWSRAITSDEVSELYGSGTPPEYPFAVATTFRPITTMIM